MASWYMYYDLFFAVQITIHGNLVYKRYIIKGKYKDVHQLIQEMTREDKGTQEMTRNDKK